MCKLAIRGHANRGKEVIEILKMLGGKDTGYGGFSTDFYFYIDEYGNITGSTKLDEFKKYKVFTLEEFLEKYPYKIGNKVNYIKYDDDDDEFSEYKIIGMMWTGNTIEYTLDSFGFTCLTKDLRLHKEKKINQMSLANCDLDEVEIVFGDKFELKIKDGRYYAIKKKPQYPKAYDECCKVLFPNTIELGKVSAHGYKGELLTKFGELLICRDAYWKIAGEQMNLGKPWEPKYEYDEEIFFIYCDRVNGINKGQGFPTDNFCLVFPTEEMLDAFYKNFKDLIEVCKEFL